MKAGIDRLRAAVATPIDREEPEDEQTGIGRLKRAIGQDEQEQTTPVTTSTSNSGIDRLKAAMTGTEPQSAPAPTFAPEKLSSWGITLDSDTDDIDALEQELSDYSSRLQRLSGSLTIGGGMLDRFSQGLPTAVQAMTAPAERKQQQLLTQYQKALDAAQNATDPQTRIRAAKTANALVPYIQKTQATVQAAYDAAQGALGVMASPYQAQSEEYNATLEGLRNRYTRYEELMGGSEDREKEYEREASDLREEAKQLGYDIEGYEALRPSTRTTTPEQMGQYLSQTDPLRERERKLSTRIRELDNKAAKERERRTRWEYNKLMDSVDTSAEDYAEKSQVNASRMKRSEVSSLSVGDPKAYVGAYQDNVYAIINGDSEALEYAVAAGLDRAYLFQRKNEKGEVVTGLTDDERARYNYLYETKGRDAANAFLEKLTPQLTAKARAENSKWWKDYAKQHPWGASAFSVLVGPAKTLSHLEQAADYFRTGQIDQNAGYNKAVHVIGDIRNQVTEDIRKNHADEGAFFYQTAMSMADFLYNALITGELFGGAEEVAGGFAKKALHSLTRPSLIAMGAEAAADAVVNYKNRGVDDTRAFILGTVSGLAEMITESVSIETLLSPDLLRDSVTKYISKNMLAEGAEEVGSNLINWSADALYDILSGQRKNEWEDAVRAYMAKGLSASEATKKVINERIESTAMDFLGGALSGGVMAGGGVGLNAVNGWAQPIIQDVQVGKQITDYQNARAAEAQLRAQRAAAESGTVAETHAEGPSVEPPASKSDTLNKALNRLNNGEELSGRVARDILADPLAMQALRESGALTENVQNDSAGRTKVLDAVREYALTQAQNAATLDTAPVITAGTGQAAGNAARTENTAPVITAGTEKGANNERTETTFRERAAEAAGGQISDGGQWRAGVGRLLQDLRNAGTARSLRIRARETASLQNQAAARNLELVSAKDQGIENGTDDKTARILTDDLLTADQKKIVAEYAKMGVTVKFMLGQLIKNEGGKPVNIRAYVSGDGKNIVVQADHTYLTWNQLLDHEELHRRIKEDVDYRSEVESALLADKKLAPYLSQIIDKYTQAYREINPRISDNDIIEELLADYRAGFDMLDPLGISNAQNAKNARTAAKDIRAVEKKGAKSETAETVSVGERFSMEAPVEETADLIAIHNLTERNLIDMGRLGGAPAPSIAIVQAKAGHSKYGPISLVYSKDTIDPQRDRRNKVYGADAWTPTAPRVDYELDYDGVIRLEEQIDKLSKSIASGMFGNSSILRQAGVDDSTTMNVDELAEKLASTDAVKAAYLAGHKGALDAVKKAKQWNKYGNDTLQKLIDRIGPQRLAQIIASLEEGKRTSEALGSEQETILQILRDYYQEAGETILQKRAQRNGWTKEEVETRRQKQVDTAIEKNVSLFTLEKFARDAWAMYEDGGATTGENDYYATQDALRQAVSDSEAEEWIKPKLEALYGKPWLYNGKDPYTASGNRRSFRQLHDAYTLENIVKAMSSQQSQRGEGLWGATATGLQATATPSYRSIADIKADSGRLGAVNSEEYNAQVSAVDEELTELINEIVGPGAHFSDREIAGSLLVEAAQGAKTIAAIRSLFAKESDLKVSEATAKKIQQVFQHAAQLPTEYFEAKPMRAVGFDEIVAAVVPTNISADARKVLDDNNVNTLEYETGNEADRLEKLNSIEGAKFSLEFDSSKLPREIVAYDDATGRYNKVNDALQQQIQAGKTITITKDELEKYADATDWGDMKAARKYVQGLFADVLGQSVDLRIGDGALIAYLTREGINHFTKFVASEKAAAAEKFYQIIENSRYAYSATMDSHGRSNAKMWDYFVCPMKIEGQNRTVPFLLSVRTVDGDVRSQIYGMGYNPYTKNKEADILHGSDPQSTATRYPNYKESSASYKDDTTNTGEVKTSREIEPEYNRTALLTEETVDRWLKDYASKSSPKYAQAYVTRMTPDQFLRLTTSRMGRLTIEEQTQELDAEKLIKATQQNPLQLKISDGEVVEHEGRHRANALLRAGVKSIPVLVFDSSNKYSKQATPEMTLQGQDFGRTRSYATETLLDLTPLSYENRDKIVRDYGTQPATERMQEKYSGRKTVKFSREITPEQDADYLSAVKSGDMETAQKMVDAAAKAAGYTVKAYHGTPNKFNVFLKSRIGSTTDYGWFGRGFYFTTKKDVADVYAGYLNDSNVIEAYLKVQNPFVFSDYPGGENMSAGEVMDAVLGKKYGSRGEMTEDDKAQRSEDFTEWLRNNGYDAAEIWSQIMILDSEQAKRTDPVTYDNAGNVIPLSERFNPENEDIRYSTEIEPDYGTTLKTAKGSPIKRNGKYGVGKEIGGRIYLHKQYAEDVIPTEDYERAQQIVAEEYPDFTYNCVEYEPKTGTIRFDEAPGFDTEREPAVGDYVEVKPDGSTRKGHTDYIWHHKWLWVKNDYQGFDVAESWNWSKKWLSTITGKTYEVNGKQYTDNGKADGNGIGRWNAQLKAYGLPLDGGKASIEAGDGIVQQGHTSAGTSMNFSKVPVLYTTVGNKIGWKPGSVNVDIGAGDPRTMQGPYLEEQQVTNLPFDPFNRSKEVNMTTLDYLRSGKKADTVTCSNCLNVIDSEEARSNVILECAKALKADGTAYFTMYAAANQGEVKSKPDQWQEARKAETYIPEIKKWFNDAVPKYGMVIATNPKEDLPKALWQVEAKGSPAGGKEDVGYAYSIEIDPDVARENSPGAVEARQLADLMRENENLKQSLKKWKAQVKTSDRTQPRESDVRRMAKDLLKEYTSEADSGETTKALQELAHAIMSNDARWTDVRDMAVRLAGDILKESSELVNAGESELFREIRSTIRGRKIAFTQKGDIPDYNEWRKQNFGRLTISKDGTPVDVLWQELQEAYGNGFFPDDITNPTDQIMYLADLWDRLQDTYVNPFSRNMAEATQMLASEIIDRVISDEIRQAPTTFADRAETRVARATLKGELRAQKIMDRLDAEKQRRKKDLSDLKEHYKTKEAKGRESRKARELREKITKHARKMTETLLHPTDKRHIPDNLGKGVAAVLSAIDLGSGYSYTFDTNGDFKRVPRGLEIGAEETKRTHAFMAVREALLKEAKGLVLDPELLGTVEEPGALTRLVTELANIPIANMNSEQLQVVYNALRGVEGAVNSANKMLSNARWAAVSEAAEAIKTENAGKTAPLELSGPLGKAKDLTRLDMLTPEAYFHRFGKAGDAIFKLLRSAQDAFTVNMKNAVDDTQQILGNTDVSALEKEKHTVTLEGQEVTMTTAQIMELYCLMQRDQGLQHITTGGIMVEPVRQGLKKTTQAEPLRPSMDELLNAIRVLTPEQLRLADELQKYLSEDMAELGNEATMKVYGYKKFGQEAKYWKIRSNTNEVPSTVEKETQTTSVANRGFTKAINPQATTSVKIGSIFDTYSQSVNDMATYAAWLAVGEDVNRIRNYIFRDENGERAGTVKGILDRVIGSGGANYLQRLMADISNGAGMDDAGLTSGFVGAYKAAAIGANIRVIIQQPTAILRAAEMIDPKYLAAGLKNHPMKAFERAKQYSPIAQWKDWGYFDINTGRKMKDVLFENPSKLEKIRQASMAMAGKADSFAWGQLWAAVEAETKDKTDLTPGTKEFYQACAERFNAIIDHTQVVDGILQRSQIMRSKNAITRMAVSFMSEPTKQYNQFMSAVYDYKHNGNKKQAKQMMARTVFSMLAAGVANVLAQSLIDALRDSDREKKYWEKLLEKFLGYNPDDKTFGEKFKTFAFSNMGELINPASYLPYAKDIMSIIQGYSVDRMDMDALSDTITAMTRLYKAMNGEGKQTTGYSIVKLAEQASKLLGLPAYNLDRDITSLFTTIINDADMPVLQYYLNSYRYKPLASGNLSADLKGILWDAKQKGDGSYDIIVDHMLKDGYPPDKIDKAMSEMFADKVGFTDARKRADAEGNNNGSYDFRETLTAIDGLEISSVDREKLLEGNLSETQFAKYIALTQYGEPSWRIDYATWSTVMLALPDSTPTQSEITEVLDKQNGLTTDEKAAIWQILSGTDKTKNNPYNQDAGAEAVEALAKAKAKVASGGGSGGQKDRAPADLNALRLPPMPEPRRTQGSGLVITAK